LNKTKFPVAGGMILVHAGPFVLLTILSTFICIEIRRATSEEIFAVKTSKKNAALKDFFVKIIGIAKEPSKATLTTPNPLAESVESR